jgi:hypothetical protein
MPFNSSHMCFPTCARHRNRLSPPRPPPPKGGGGVATSPQKCFKNVYYQSSNIVRPRGHQSSTSRGVCTPAFSNVFSWPFVYTGLITNEKWTVKYLIYYSNNDYPSKPVRWGGFQCTRQVCVLYGSAHSTNGCSERQDPPFSRRWEFFFKNRLAWLYQQLG